MDARKNFAVSSVATPPSPATSGTTLVVATGEGTRFPTPPFNATIRPADALPTPANSEIVRVTGIATDTLTITRAQEGSSARAVAAADLIYASVTDRLLNELVPGIGRFFDGTDSYLCVPGVQFTQATTGPVSANQDEYAPFFVQSPVTVDRLVCEVTTAGAAGATLRMGIYNADGDHRPTTLVVDGGTVATDTTGVKTATVNVTLNPGRYLTVINSSVAPNLRTLLGGSWFVQPTMSSFIFPTMISNARTYAAFPSTAAAIAQSGMGSGNSPFKHFVMLRLSAMAA